MQLTDEEQQAIDRANAILELKTTPAWKLLLEKIEKGLKYLDDQLTGTRKLTAEEYSAYFERREGVQWVLGELEEEQRIRDGLVKKSQVEFKDGPDTGHS
jgi:hypothetical protein